MYHVPLACEYSSESTNEMDHVVECDGRDNQPVANIQFSSLELRTPTLDLVERLQVQSFDLAEIK